VVLALSFSTFVRLSQTGCFRSARRCTFVCVCARAQLVCAIVRVSVFAVLIPGYQMAGRLCRPQASLQCPCRPQLAVFWTP
jgi:hypothetical protein